MSSVESSIVVSVDSTETSKSTGVRLIVSTMESGGFSASKSLTFFIMSSDLKGFEMWSSAPELSNKSLLKPSKSLAKRSTFVELNFGSFLIFLDNSNPVKSRMSISAKTMSGSKVFILSSASFPLLIPSTTASSCSKAMATIFCIVILLSATKIFFII